MIRKVLVAGALASIAVGAAPAAAADNGHYDTDVPGMNYDAALTAPCDNTETFTFGRGPGGEALQCRWVPNQWPPVYTGFWQISYPLYGVQAFGAPCPNPRGSAAQSPDGLPLVCTENGWQVDPRG
jgi:hypothetical protein